MTGLPDDIQAALAAVAPGGVDYSSTASPQGTVTAWCALANSEDLPRVGAALHMLGARLAMVSALQPPAPEEDEEEASTEGEAATPSRKRRRPSLSAGR